MNTAPLFDLVPASIACIDRSGTIVAVNRTWRDFARANGGREDIEIGIGLNYLDICNQVQDTFVEYARAAVQGIRQVIDGVIHTFELEYPCHTSLEQHWSILRVVPVDEAVNHVLIMHFMITSTKLAEIEAQQQQKRASLSLLAGGIAHDVNNLLLVAMVQLSASRYQFALEHPIQERLEKATFALERTAALARQLLAYSGGTTSNKERIELNQFIEEHLSFIQGLAIEKNADLVADLCPEKLHTLANQEELFQVLLNLITNSIEAVKPNQKGNIRIKTARQDLRQTDTLVDIYTGVQLPAGSYLCLSVEDNHSGIPSSVLRSIFDPFFTSKGGPRGLGLSIITGIVRDHGGIIQVTSEVGKGTLFSIYLPLVESGEVEEGTTPSQAYAAETTSLDETNKTIFVIDDDLVILNAICDLLVLLEYEAIPIADGPTLEVHLNRPQPYPAYAILDMTIPNEDTQQIFIRLREAYPDIKIILSSGHNYHSVAQSLMETSKNVIFLPKPYTIEKLLEMLKQF